MIRHIMRFWWRKATCRMRPFRSVWRAPSKCELRRQNVEYVCKRDSLRLGPVRILPIPNGSWAQFQRRRLVRSGGTVEQYKQPHLVPDLHIAESFRSLEPVS